jgi:hypothetical protein
LLFALIHCGPILPELVEGDNRQVLPVFWQFCPIAKTIGGRQRPSGQAMREKQRDSGAGRSPNWPLAGSVTPASCAIAARLRSKTTLPIKWIAARVQIGTAKGAKSVLPHLAQSQDQRKTASALEPCTQLEFQSTV